MNGLIQQLQQQWLDRSEQERRLMSIAAPLLLLAILYYGIWQPVQEALQLAQRQVQAETTALAQVKQNAIRYVSNSGASKGASAAGSLSQIVNRTAQGNRIEIERMQPQGDKLQLTLADVQFTQLLTWLNEVSAQGVQISALDISNTDKSGMVQVRRLQLAKL
ncbi:type II secretion system protein M [Ferrimonas senticii]|uniref:type II secretion system protein M n=1 Tax=Ferrimonas senticii TaxID=394566 RepID=UPI0004232342|nr:type II secretion system protein M [Ferrimonas senticii]